MDKTEAQEAYSLLLSLCRVDEAHLVFAYKQMRDLLERICRQQMSDERLQMTDLSARISYLSARWGLSLAEQNRLHTFRLTSNRLLNRQALPARSDFLRDAKTLTFLVHKLSGEDIPRELYVSLPRADATYVVAPPTARRIPRMRVCFQYADEQFLYVLPTDEVSDKLCVVRYNVPQINEEFADTCRILWRHAQLNLLDVAVGDDGILVPSFIVLEPDYLIDISALAECFREYGHHPGNYFLSRLQPIENARPLLIGNIANLFLDEWIHAEGEVDYRACMQKAFRRYPIELAACSDLHDPATEKQFFADCKMHFEHIRDTVNNTFPQPGYELDKTDAVLEPSYICEALGLQGRLDYMQRDMSAFIEMKSGKADEYAIRGKVVPKENNWVQMLLYQAVLQYSMGKDHNKVRSFLLYTRYPLLYPSRSSWAMVRRAINLRNRIVADEYGVQLRNSLEYTALKLSELNSSTLNEKNLSGYFWDRYLAPSIDAFGEKLHPLSALEKHYFYALYNFITKELYYSKSGDVEYDTCRGAASLWLSSLADKCEAGEIMYRLRIKENHATDAHKAHLLLEQTQDVADEFLPNFRQGDAVVLYERNSDSDNVTNRMVFKGNIEYLHDDEICVRLRATQRNLSVLPADSFYAIEHDVMDTIFRYMYQGLYAFLSTTRRRRELLLLQRPAEVDASFTPRIAAASDDFDRVVCKALAARDYFLLVGPPGTGKTSCALRKMVEAFYAADGVQLLLLSYTNRAVDEICKSLLSIQPAVDFIRIGSELACSESYRPYLIENVLAGCTRRSDVVNCIRNCRIIVGTVAALSAKSELFRLKHFDVAIVDEATQILESQLLGILCARDADGREAVGKFILIGDHKQLPAVVQQSEAQSAVHDDLLHSVGLDNMRNSLFERLYRHARRCSATYLYDMLCRQGRMHPDVASFVNRAFYENRLLSLGLPHQLEHSEHSDRLLFYPSAPDENVISAKINHSEAQIVANLALQIYNRHADDFDAQHTLGVIAPYRSQIALIRQYISRLNIPALNNILVDTVERFQGSERDVIVYSFCLNYPYQLTQLSSLTEEDDILIDRKLNVALTRARKQLILTGNPSLMRRNPLYNSLLDSVKCADLHSTPQFY